MRVFFLVGGETKLLSKLLLLGITLGLSIIQPLLSKGTLGYLAHTKKAKTYMHARDYKQST